MKEQANDARISTLTEASLILHLTTAGLPHSDLNKSAKTIIIEELRQNPDQTDLNKVIAKLKGLEADHLATADKTAARQVNQEFMCKICNKKHARGKCSYTCKHCKRMGHKSEVCWVKYGKPPKRERSASTERTGSNTGIRMKDKKNPKHNSRQVFPSDSATDKEFTQSDSKVEETPNKEEPKHSSRKVRGITKNKVRKTRSKKKENSDSRDKDLTRSAPASHLAALSGSGHCHYLSSEVLDDSEE